MISIHRKDVPPFLRNGFLYTSLDSEDTESFEVPSNCFKKDTCIASMADLKAVLHSTRYWGVEQLPVSIVSFLVNHNAAHRYDDLVPTFPEYKKFFRSVRQVGLSPPDQTISTAIKVGLGVVAVRYLHQREHFDLNSCAYVTAAERDDLSSMKYLHESGCKWHEKTISAAITRGSLRCLVFAYGHMPNGTLPPECMQLAAEAGRIPVMQMLQRMGIFYDKYIYVTAANLTVVKHLRGIGCEWVTNHCSHFAGRNMLDCLIFANAHGCRWNAHTTQTAALHGGTKILHYLRTHGCPWDAQVVLNAAQKGYPMCLKYALTRGCPCTWRALLCAIKERKWTCVMYLIRYRYAQIAAALLFGIVCACYVVMCFVRAYFS